MEDFTFIIEKTFVADLDLDTLTFEIFIASQGDNKTISLPPWLSCDAQSLEIKGNAPAKALNTRISLVVIVSDGYF